jgi:prepilin-type N-terminal cleavage/methylation domain-containing protein
MSQLAQSYSGSISVAQHAGSTLVELMVALAVSSIVIAGTYAGYTVFARQQQLLLAQTEYDRNAMRAIDMMSSDIRLAGYRDYLNPNAMAANQPISILSSSPGDLVLVFDDYDSLGNLYRALIHYYLQPFSSATGKNRNRLFREWKKCNNPVVICNLGNSSPQFGSAGGEPLVDWVTSFIVEGLHPKSYGSFATQFQSVKITFALGSGQVIEGTSKSVARNYTFVARARNVSLVP